MRLLQLTINNFKAIDRLGIEACGRDVSVWGDNATGKTTIADSLSWLLFNKDSRGQADFGIKHWSDREKNRLDHEVEAMFDDGPDEDNFTHTATLKKVFREKWTRKRGSATEEFTGHTTEYFVNGVPMKEKEYQASVAEICPEHLFSLLTSPTAFSAIHWQKQRAILLEVCGDVSDADIIASNPDFKHLPKILGGKRADDWKKIAAGRKAEINKRLLEIPARIDELKKSMPELEITNSQSLIDKLTKLREQLAAKDTEIATIQAGGGVVELQKRLAMQESILSDLKSKQDHANDENRKKNSAALQDAQFRLGNVAGMIADTARKLSHANDDIANITEVNMALAERWKEANARQFTLGPCPTCGQDIPEEQAEAARASFNTIRSNDLESITSKGFANNAKLKDLKQQVEEWQALQAKLEADRKQIDADIAALREPPPQVVPTEDVAKEQTAKRERDALLAEIQSVNAGKIGDVTEKRVERDAIQADIATAEKALAAIEQSMDISERVAALAAEEKTLANEYAKIEGELYLVEQFTRAKVALLDARVNEKFEIVRFKLTEEQLNGGITDTCKMTVDGVPYADLNSAARIQGGLDIIRTLSAHYGITLPIVVDNRESVTSIPDMNGAQVISLFVSEADKALRVEVAQ
jgi:DNA repair exonuclease SbcCD ATPase subunit